MEEFEDGKNTSVGTSKQYLAENPENSSTCLFSPLAPWRLTPSPPSSETQASGGGAASYIALAVSHFTDEQHGHVVGEDFPEVFLDELRNAELTDGLTQVESRSSRQLPQRHGGARHPATDLNIGWELPWCGRR